MCKKFLKFLIIRSYKNSIEVIEGIFLKSINEQNEKNKILIFSPVLIVGYNQKQHFKSVFKNLSQTINIYFLNSPFPRM
jgi:hypothetical protein